MKFIALIICGFLTGCAGFDFRPSLSWENEQGRVTVSRDGKTIVLDVTGKSQARKLPTGFAK